MKAVASRPPLGWRRVLSTGLLIGAAAALFAGLLAAHQADAFGWDFRMAYLPAARDVLEGGSPFPQLGDAALGEGRGYVYPPLLAVSLAPLTILPIEVASVAAVLGSIAALMAALAVVGLRDIRCYASVLVAAPVWNAFEMANVSASLALAIAVTWRYRDDVLPPALALGLAVSTKLLLAPLYVWTLATRRLRATVYAVAVAVVATLAAWASIGFAGLTGYVTLLQRLSEIQAEKSYSFVGMAATLGVDVRVGQTVALLTGGCLLVGCAVFARRNDDLRSFTCAVAATIALSPIVWLHYLVFLYIPLAVARPRFSAIWLLPVVLWLSPRGGNGDGVETFLPIATAAIVFLVLLVRPRAADVLAEAPA